MTTIKGRIKIGDSQHGVLDKSVIMKPIALCNKYTLIKCIKIVDIHTFVCTRVCMCVYFIRSKKQKWKKNP